MKFCLKSGLLATLLAITGIANADWSANLGFASEYYYFLPEAGLPMSAMVSR